MDQLDQILSLRLTGSCHIGPISHGLLMRHCGLANASLATIPAMTKRGSKNISSASITIVKSELYLIEASGTVLFWRDSEYYPSRLAQYDDVPSCKTTISNLHLLTQLMIAIVWARNA